MPVACPVMEWAGSLEECGPAADPSIMLRARARMGGVPLEVMAIRVNPELRGMPDYRQDLPIELYQTGAMETTLDELEYLIEVLGEVTDSTSQSVIELETGPYVICVLPAH